MQKIHDPKYFENLKNHYSRLVIKYGDSYKSVDWGSENTQKIRFRTLLEALDFQSARILDVGCGVGHLVDYLLENKFKGSYTGVDLVEEMVRQAANRYPEMNFIKIDSLDDLNRTDVELVIASGLFTFANESILQETIMKLFEISNNCLAFNSLSTWVGKPEPNEFYADPISTLEFCRSLTRKVVLRHEYLPHDFSIYLYK